MNILPPDRAQRKAQYILVYEIRQDAKKFPNGHAEHARLMKLSDDIAERLNRTRPRFCTVKDELKLKTEALREVTGTNGDTDIRVF